MSDLKWTKEALVARAKAASALDHGGFSVTTRRAQLRLEYYRLVTAVDGSEMNAGEAAIRFKEIATEAGSTA